MELTNDISDALLLSAPQPDFEHDGDTFSNALLLHRLLATGKEEQVVSRRGELNRDLVKRTCTRGGASKVRCRVRLEFGFETTLGEISSEWYRDQWGVSN